MKAERDVGFGPRARTIPQEAVDERELRRLRNAREEAALVRRRRNQRLRRIAVPVLLCALAIAAVLGWRSGFLAEKTAALEQAFAAQLVKSGLVIDDVTVSGLHHLPKGEVLEAAAIPRGTAIFAVDLEGVRDRVAMIGWVREVAVSRQFPNTVRIDVVERTPIAVWQHHGRLMLIDNTGTVITSAGIEQFMDLPQVVGEGAQVAAASFVPVLRSEPALYAEITAAIRVGSRRWDVLFKNGVRARLPESGEGPAWRRLAELQAKHGVLGREIQIVDLRQEDRLVLRLTPDEVKRRQLSKTQANDNMKANGGQI